MTTYHRAGWGRPLNSTDRTHWWRPDGSPACDPGSTDRYVGPKTAQVELEEVCPDCVVAVAAAVEVIGGDLAGSTATTVELQADRVGSVATSLDMGRGNLLQVVDGAVADLRDIAVALQGVSRG